MCEVTCPVCARHCRLREGMTGFCRARGVRDGKLVSLNYGVVTSLALDPIEKKPLYRFFPGSRILSVGSFGCNLACPFCQNHEISQQGTEAFLKSGSLPESSREPAAGAERIPPEDLAEAGG